MSKVKAECELGTFAAIGPFSDELMTLDSEAIIDRLSNLSGIEAAQLILATFRRSDAVVGNTEMDDLSELLGVFEDDED